MLFRSEIVLSIVFLLPLTAFAQSPADSQGQAQEFEGVKSGGYIIHQSIDMGVRASEVSGSGNMYDTLVNLHTGPRILDQTFSMRSEDQNGFLFDNFYVNSFGWGGEPNNVLRARVDKIRWYDFQASFHRDQNFFDYDLLANPLNPATSSPSVPVLNSPHSFATTRRMSDIDLTLLPQSRVSIRLGYSRNNMTGPSYSDFHLGTEALLYQPWNTTLNSYRIGVDWKVLPRTVVSYDQYLDYYKGDTNWQLAPFGQALLPNGAPVDLGLTFNTVAKQPCAVPTGSSSIIDSSGVLTNLSCSSFQSYSRFQRVRTSTPTERVSFRSNYWTRLELAGSFAYSSAELNAPLNESATGLPGTNTRAYTLTGPARARRISNVGDFSATVFLTDHLRLVDKFYYWSFRSPGNVNLLQTSQVCTPPNCNLLTPLSQTTQTTTNTVADESFNQTWKRNQIELVWDISRKFGARIGYRYGDQELTHINNFITGDIDHWLVHGHTAILGLWARPIRSLRLNFDWEHTNNDNTIVRIAPRKESRYRLQAGYTPRPWAVLGGSVNLVEDHNDAFLVNYAGHNRNYGLTASLAPPQQRFSVDLAYNYGDFLQNSSVCFKDIPPAGVVLPVVVNAGSCAAYDPTNNPLLTKGYYTNHTHYAMSAFVLRPVKRVTTKVGYSITSVGGSTPQFNNLQPDAALNYKYHQPMAALGVDLGHRLSWNAAWNYYQYGEGSFVGPTAPRNFHANNTTISLHYEF